jgi:hypothetical protein
MGATTVDNLVMVAAIVIVVLIVVLLMVSTPTASAAMATAFATLRTFFVIGVIIKLYNIRVVRYMSM